MSFYYNEKSDTMQYVMKYENIVEGKFIARPNRFIAEVEIAGKRERAHVKNTGRCRELLIPNTTIYLEDYKGKMGTRKMRYSLISVKKGDVLINMDSQAPNKVCEEALLSGILKLPELGNLRCVKREKTFGDSRFDFYVEDEDGRRGWLEVKGVTLEEEGIASFPDAPTERGVKHVEELIKAVKAGYRGYVLFVIQMTNVRWFEPNDVMHKAFGDALRKAKKEGVHILAATCKVTTNTLDLQDLIEIKLD